MCKINSLCALFFICLLFTFCTKDKRIENPVIENNNNSSLALNFKAVVDNLPLIPNTKWYKNFHGDSFTVIKFNYYISNIKLKKDDGSLFLEQNSYHLIKNVDGKNSFTITGIPNGDYNQIEFLIGIDSLRNVSGAQTGDLSPDSLMFWEWNSGYIFFKLEGHYKTLTNPVVDYYSMHIGGFIEPDNFIKKCTFNIDEKLALRKNKMSSIFYNVNINEIFMNPTEIDLDTYSSVGGGKKSKDISDNYKDMFTIDRIEN